MDLETLLMSPDGFGLETATPVQRAACRVLSGVPLNELADNPDVVQAFGGRLPPAGRVLELLLLAAIRSGKSLISACAAVWASQTCDMSGLGPGEVPRVSIMSVRLDQADVVLRHHVIGRIQASRIMRSWLISEPTGDSVFLRHPSGRPVEIRVVAGSRAGSSLVARWSAGVIFDEAARMVGSEDGVVNLDESRAAVRGRMLPGAPIIYISSPWAPFGPVYDMVSERFGKPGSDLCVMRASGPMMNPRLWTPKACRDLERRDPTVYRTDVLGEFMDPEQALFASEMLRHCTRESPTISPPEKLMHYVAAMDPATRSNAWTFVIVGCRWGGPAGARPDYFVALAKQWKVRKGDRISPRVVLEEIHDLCEQYRISEVHTDQYSADALRDLALAVGLDVTDHTIGQVDKFEMLSGLHTLISDGRVELALEPDLLRDLTMLKKKVIQNGVSFVLPKTADGRHCDYAPALALALRYPPEPPDAEEPIRDWLEERREQMANREQEPYWEHIAERFMGAA